MPTFAAVEGGGTTFVVAIGEGTSRTKDIKIVERAEFPTLVPPSKTISQVVAWLSTRHYDALGVACFGPVDLEKSSPTWGYITSTPKPGWQDTDIMGPLLAARNIPCSFNTDVNAPALEEFRHFSKPNEESCAYITVGTGIGVGLVMNGKCVKGLVHPEGGHICGMKRPSDRYPGDASNPHPWCIEALCNAKAIAERAGVRPDQLEAIPDDSEVWNDVAYGLGSLCATLTALCSVERIVLSGGVMQRKSLFPKIRKATREILNGYIQHPKVLTDGPDGIDSFIVPSERGNNAGIYGALALAQDAYAESQDKAVEIAGPVKGKTKSSGVSCFEGCFVQ
eukprot:TRINITY_DN65985_c0_g1_i1.p1 TRINITY_DN65985_c0_g1~~TRINITY_DN65985_c0_g1_i1.p1  ORF type:complete len:337 (-),score=47.97 TRINITY_DN65985_c0_g1_i1:74-1084(-)